MAVKKSVFLTIMHETKYLRKKDFFDIIKFVLTFIPGKIYKKRYPDIWVISEYEENARDNGYWLFKYIRETYPNKLVYYPIKRKSSDYNKVAMLGNIIEFGSWKHFVLFWAAKKYLGTTQNHGFPNRRICGGITALGMHGFKYVFLNHGFARGKSASVYAPQTYYDLIIAMSKLEKDIIVKENLQNPRKVVDIGFCRFDNLNNVDKKDNVIVVMPTWREWLDFRYLTDKTSVEEVKKKFLQSNYFKKYQQMLSDKHLLEYLESNNLHLVFYLHGYAQEYAKYFQCKSTRVIIAKKERYFVQDLLKKGALLITDYSSVVFDFCYMKKPVIYFQFDAEEFAEKQYAEGKYYKYSDDGFGPICKSVEEVVNKIMELHNNQFSMEEKYLKRVEKFFDCFDTKHCERTYKIINEL